MMENCNYDRTEMMVFNMVRQGLFGEILHAEGRLPARSARASSSRTRAKVCGAARGRQKLNGNLYPTHGLGPVANCLDINRGDRFDYLVSMSGPSRGLQAWATEHFPADAPQRAEKYVLGDVNVSLIKTARGRTIYVSTAPTCRGRTAASTWCRARKGMFQGYPNRVYIEGKSPSTSGRMPRPISREFDHPLWDGARPSSAEGAGHGGMDYIEDYRLIKCLREGLPTDMNVYDAARSAPSCT